MNPKKMKTIVISLILLYFFIGFVFNMFGEFRQTEEYGLPPKNPLANPSAYLRSAVFSPFWPIFLGANIYNYQSPFGRPVNQ